MVQTEDVPVANFLLIKRIVDDDAGDLFMVGTMVQYLCADGLDINVGGEEKDVPEGKVRVDVEDIDDVFFGYRFNDLTAEVGGDMIQPRMTQRFKDDTLLKRTYQFHAPLAVDDIFDRFPFKIVTGSLTIELSSSTLDDGNLKLVPNMAINTEDKRNNISIQVPLMKHVEGENDTKKKLRTIDAIIEQMDKMKSYQFLNVSPSVQYFCDKNGCSKCRVQFYLVEEGISKFVEILAPMLLVAVMNTLNVTDDQGPDNADFLANAATFALTAVFILPSITGKSNRTKIWSYNNLFILLVFIGLSLSSFPEELVGSNGYAYAGMIILWSSFLIPLFNAYRYRHFIVSKVPNLKTNNYVDLGDAKETRYSPKKHDFKEKFMPAKDFMQDPKKMEEVRYKEGEKLGKFDILEYKEKEKRKFF